MDPTPIDDQHHLFLSFTEGRHHVVHRVAQLLGITVRHDFREDCGGAILHRTNDAEQHATGDPTPGAILHPCVPFETLVPFDLTRTQRPCGQASALGFAPPARPGQGKTPEDGFIFIEHNDLTPTSPVLQGGKFERRPRQLSGGGSEPPGGTAGADGLFFSHLTDALAAHLHTGLAGEHRGEFLTTPLGMAGAVLEGVLVDEPIEVVCQRAGHGGWATGAGAIHQALHPLVGKAMDPLAQRSIGKCSESETVWRRWPLTTSRTA